MSDRARKEYSEWFMDVLGHKYLTFLDYAILEVAEKRVEAQLAER
jgi:hypothetical protein